MSEINGASNFELTDPHLSDSLPSLHHILPQAQNRSARCFRPRVGFTLALSALVVIGIIFASMILIENESEVGKEWKSNKPDGSSFSTDPSISNASTATTEMVTVCINHVKLLCVVSMYFSLSKSSRLWRLSWPIWKPKTTKSVTKEN